MSLVIINLNYNFEAHVREASAVAGCYHGKWWLVSGLQSPGGYCTNILSLSLFSLYICHLSYSDIKLKHSYWLGFSMKKIMHDKH